MTLQQLFIGWFYYGIMYMGLSVMVTILLNRLTKRWYLPPLIINAIAVIVMLLSIRYDFLPESEQAFALYFIYMPIVAASFIFNLVLMLFNKFKETRN